MSYRVRKKESVQTTVQRVALEQIDKSIGEIANPELDRHQVVHQVRKRCKKLRGLIRLIRPNFAAYDAENKFFRDAARELSSLRDAQSVLSSFETLITHCQDPSQQAALAPIRKELTARRDKFAADAVGLQEKLEAFLANMLAARLRVEHWTIAGRNFSAVSGGLTKTYRRGRKALRRAYNDPSAETFHELRKRLKYHWYHLNLLRGIWPAMMKVQRRACEDLSELLGDEHDLAVLRQTLLLDPSCSDNCLQLQAVIEMIDARRAQLQHRAKPLAQRVFAEKPQRISDRFHGYWKTWKVKPNPSDRH